MTIEQLVELANQGLPDGQESRRLGFLFTLAKKNGHERYDDVYKWTVDLSNALKKNGWQLVSGIGAAGTNELWVIPLEG